jgi:PRC-barrel domain
MSMLSATTLEGTDIKNSSGDNLGDIKDLMIDLDTGRVAYAVVEFGGLLGIGSKLFAVPLPALKQDADDKSFVLDTTKEALEHQPGFDKDHWPNFADRKWQTAVHEHYKAKPYWM